ncbi:MAG: 16S rRNA (guanine(527)-N(7))-methyltransferase RsmG [Rubricoccaceae bacterium]
MPWNPADDLTDAQRAQLHAFGRELARVSRRVNLVSPATIPHLHERHLVHSLTLAYRSFPKGAIVVDFGAGGGLPAVPLAIRFPEVHFVAVDAVGKKTEAVRLFARRLGLDNLEAWNGRAETWDGTAHYAVSRATAPLASLWAWFARVRHPWSAPLPTSAWAPGLIVLKGGDLAAERAALLSAYPDLRLRTTDLGALLGASYFADKAIVEVQPS